MRLLALALSLALTPTLLRTADMPTVIDLWPGAAPGEMGKLPPESDQPQKPGQRVVKRIQNVSKPTLSIFRPAKDKDTGVAVVIAPGGGYNILAWDLEGEEVAAWLNSIGVTGVVLKYRVPRRPTDKDGAPLGAKQDAQRAMSLVRSKAGEWGLDPKKIGMLGFSAGGHLTAWTCANCEKRSYEAVDDADKASCRPDFAVLVYPGYIVPNEKKDELRPDIVPTKDSPPMFFAHAFDDPVAPENSVRLFLELKKLRVPAELHIYSTGGHGFGLRPDGKPCATWPARCGEWMAAQGIIPATKAK